MSGIEIFFFKNHSPLEKMLPFQGISLIFYAKLLNLNKSPLWWLGVTGSML